MKAFYFDAAFAKGGRSSSFQAKQWFWKHTRAGRMILDLLKAACVAGDRNLRMISGSLVAAELTFEYLQRAGRRS